VTPFRNPVLFELKGLPAAVESEESLQMDQDSFRALYEHTARSIRLFLLRRTGSEHLADDMLQETYYRFLRANRSYESARHRRNYLFRIAANVANDALRKGGRAQEVPGVDPEDAAAPSAPNPAPDSLRRTDLARAMQSLSPRQRDALWLAYAEGSTHEEIAEILGLRKASVKPLLFRARARLASLLKGDDGRRA
jgi:RNA polymerase sigma-70 factor (ECF subfamily)